MYNPTRVLFLVAMLTTLTSSGEPLDSKVGVIHLSEARVRFHFGIEDSDRHARCMNSASAFCWGNSLDSMSTSLLLELGQILPDDEQLDAVVRNSRYLSTEAYREIGVCRSQVLGEQLCVGATFGTLYLDHALHRSTPVKRKTRIRIRNSAFYAL